MDDAETHGHPTRVAKILNNPRPERRARFVQEVGVTERFDHPNVVRALASDETKMHRQPFFVMPYYEKGTLEDNHQALGSPLDRLQTFLSICQGVAYAHGKGLIHRDLKPANIFLCTTGTPMVGDFGLCYRHEVEARITLTEEAVGARKYMPPEWREGRVDIPQPSGDIYSLGKILYWMFVGTEYDGHEDDHQSKEHRIVNAFWSPPTEHVSSQAAKNYFHKWVLAFFLADEIVGSTLRKNPNERIDYAVKLIEIVRHAIARIEREGRVLDLELPKRCLFCATGAYQPAHRSPLKPGSPVPFPDLQDRHKLTGSTSIQDQRSFAGIRSLADHQFGFANLGTPLILICDYCGNVQYFRLDLTRDGKGENWRP